MRSARSAMPPAAAALRICVAAAGVSVNMRCSRSMFALGPQQAGHAVALFLWSAAGKEVVQVVVAAALRPPDLREVADHHAHLRLYAMLGVVLAQEADQLPVLVGQHQSLAFRERTGEF